MCRRVHSDSRGLSRALLGLVGVILDRVSSQTQVNIVQWSVRLGSLGHTWGLSGSLGFAWVNLCVPRVVVFLGVSESSLEGA